jgi:spermidine/putrescine transport system permease protein
MSLQPQPLPQAHMSSPLHWGRFALTTYGVALFVFLFVPLLTVAVFAFNDSSYPALPWKGWTLDWFLADPASGRAGLLFDAALLHSVWTSVVVATWVALLSTLVGTANALLIERAAFPGKSLLALMMMVPLVIPGVILGISILAFASRLANAADALWGVEWDFLRPGLPLVVLGQFAYIVSMSTLIIGARLKRLDPALEEAAYNLGASRPAVLATITLAYLKPALVSAAALAFLMSFENFNTTLMLVGSDAPLTILMYGRMREGATPVVNAVSVVLMLASALVAWWLTRRGDSAAPAAAP